MRRVRHGRKFRYQLTTTFEYSAEKGAKNENISSSGLGCAHITFFIQLCRNAEPARKQEPLG
jgi:hypothetical protein